MVPPHRNGLIMNHRGTPLLRPGPTRSVPNHDCEDADQKVAARGEEGTTKTLTNLQQREEKQQYQKHQ